tara:strand:- start:552 stop:1619 length:1068 start_codon:yes stop_codon:yes gene_type:complete
MKPTLKHMGYYHGASFSPDGERILAIGHSYLTGNFVAIWNANSGSKEHELIFEGEPNLLKIAVAKFNNDGDRIVVLAEDGHDNRDGIRILHSVSGEQIFHLGEGHGLDQFALSRTNDTLLAVGSDWKSLRIWNFKTGKLIRDGEFEPGGEPLARISPNGQQYFLTLEDKRPAGIFDIHTGKEVVHFGSGYWDGTFSPEGNDLLLWWDHADLWDATTGQKTREFGKASHAGFSPDGKHIFTASREQNWIRIWNRSNGEKVFELQNFQTQQWYANQEPGTPTFSDDGLYIATCEDNFARIRSLASGELIKEFECPQGAVTAVTFRPLSHQIVITSWAHVETSGYAGLAPSMFVGDLQ